MYAQWKAIGIAAAVLLGLLVASQGMTATAAPPDAPLAGITVTPTDMPTATPTVTPTLTPGVPVTRHEFTDPVIQKIADPREVKPGEDVIFTLHVVNRGNVAAVEVVVTDDIPAYLEIREVTTSQGKASFVGQRVTVQVGTMGPDFAVTILIHTRVKDDTPAPLTVENVAILACPNCSDRWARAEVDIIGIMTDPPRLPPAGGLGSWWMVAACLGTGLVGLSLALSKRGPR